MIIPVNDDVGNSGVIFGIVIAIHFENIFIVFVQIINIMQHMMKEVKAVTKKYETKSGIKESTSKRVDLGVTDIFETGECVAVISKTDFDNIDETIADKDATIGNLNDSIDKYKAELKSKFDEINGLSQEIKALKTTVDNLESDISAKDETIDSLTKDVTVKDGKINDSGKIIDGLNDKIDELTATVGELKSELSTKDVTISELEKQIAVYDAMDVDKLMEKASELDKSKDALTLRQSQIREYIQLVNHKDKENTALRNQKWYHKALGRDATADIQLPPLNLIDESGNIIVNDDPENVIGDSDDSDKSGSPDET